MAPIQRLIFATLGLLCVCALPVLSQPGFNPYPDYSCPAGYIPIARFSPPENAPVPSVCDEDKCYNEAVGCGPGNVCTQRPVGSVGGYFYEHDCQCKPPYVKGNVVGYKGLGTRTTCYIPGQDPCASNPCQNGGTCQQIRTTLNIPPNFPEDPNGPIIDFFCQCPPFFTGKTCLLPEPSGSFPTPVLKNGPPPSTPPSGPQGSEAAETFHPLLTAECDGIFTLLSPFLSLYPNERLFESNKRCLWVRRRFHFPHPLLVQNDLQKRLEIPPLPCSVCFVSNSFFFEKQSKLDNLFLHVSGVCGVGDASSFPTRCWFNNDPQGRYVCCDGQGCDGFNPDNLTPHCKNFGFVPPNFGAGGSTTPPSKPPTVPPSGPQGVCGSGDASSFPTRCWFNNDPQGRYVCCDGHGCDGFNSDNLTPHCKNFGFVPPNFGAGGSTTPPSGPPPSGSQGACGAGGAADFPVRCWYNNDPQGRYVCCDGAGCDGFNPPDNFFPRCKNNGFVPPQL
ncbi:hypothetical protein KFL_004990060 [Klebsormidium nitens]|uniref:EGF-like domain-containing protein n=1 Tax=Klebsormidium nitens TaxID=105231 RepID=A0A1Y1IJA5_KLENI|nr:hypothetical protein KFL_004990060 [Klebsormidium nitens]|eukprot:GAQ89221.1 hypothetical protein KFL_004990060 [Klebsormidium nitens]